MRYFKKELLSNKLWLKATGAPVVWENVGGDTGVLATESQIVIDELDQAIARGIGGVVSSDQAEYESLKKKASSSQSLSSSKDRWALSGLTLPNLPGQNGGLVAVASSGGQPIHGQMTPHLKDQPKETPDPIAVTTEFTRPKVSKGFFKRVEKIE